jgi:hypothetical protein
MSDEIKLEVPTPADTTELPNADLAQVTGGTAAAAPKKINVSAGVIAGNKLGGMTPQYPAVSEQNSESAAELSEPALDELVGGTARDAASGLATGKRIYKPLSVEM